MADEETLKFNRDHMKSKLASGLLLSLAFFVFSVGYYVGQPSLPAASNGSVAGDEFVSCEGRLEMRTELYMKDNHHYLGRVMEVQPKHGFPNGLPDGGVLIDFQVGGKPLWVPFDACHKLYVVKKAN